MKKIALFFFLMQALCWAEAKTPKNIILFIGDGMGFDHVKAGGLYLHGAAGTLRFEAFPTKSQMTTASANNAVTDSGASATAMATGQKVNNGVISKQIPGNGADLPTVLEYYKSAGKHTGLVTNADVTDATPAAFGAHAANRNSRAAIAAHYLTQSRPNVVMGASLYFSSVSAMSSGYTALTRRAELLALDTENTTFLSGHFRPHSQMEWEAKRSTTAPNEPSLTEMTVSALSVLDNNPNGFFLLVENEGIDVAGHNETNADPNRRLMYLVTEMESFSNAVQAAMDWAAGRDDTLIIVTSDHETGNLNVSATSNEPGVVPSTSAATFGSTVHTARAVPVYAWGVSAERAAAVTDNTGIYTLLMPPAQDRLVIDPPVKEGLLALSPGMHRLQGGLNGYINAAGNETAKLHFNATGPGEVIWDIFETNGQDVRTLTTYTNGLAVDFIEWNALNSRNSRVGPGVYLYRIRAPGISKNGKLVVID